MARRGPDSRLRRRERRLREIEAVFHAVRGGGARVERWQAEVDLTETHEAHVRVLGLRDIPFPGVGAQHQAADPPESM